MTKWNLIRGVELQCPIFPIWFPFIQNKFLFTCPGTSLKKVIMLKFCISYLIIVEVVKNLVDSDELASSDRSTFLEIYFLFLKEFIHVYSLNIQCMQQM